MTSKNTKPWIFLMMLISGFLFGHGLISAQSPVYFSYQAVITDNSGNPVQGNVAIRINILQFSETGESVYGERHVRETDEHGFVSLRIGEGSTVYKGKLDTINWAQGPFFLKMDVDPSGGYSYPLSTITELLSVPYALHARTAENLISGFQETDPVFMASVAYGISQEDTSRWNKLSDNSQLQIGDFFAGGIIFFIEPGTNHGLVAHTRDMNATWGLSGTLAGAAYSYNGSENTDKIVALAGQGNYAAYICDTMTFQGYSDWYLPSIDELFSLFKESFILNKILGNDGDANTDVLGLGQYWSSTEKDAGNAFMLELGRTNAESKAQSATIRAIRRF